MDYDVFNSYSSADRDWAAAVNRVLSGPGTNYRTFFDINSLRVGDDWESSIQGALERSRHLVLLWSDEAKQSDWVTRELWTFVSTAKPKTNTSRRLIVVNLQGMNQATKPYQQINTADIQSAYPVAANVGQPVWDALRRTIQEGLNPTRRTLEVPLVVLTTTAPELQALSAQRWAWLQADFQTTQAQILAQYGNGRDDWHPFAGAQPISDVLETLRGSVNNVLTHYTFEWRQPDATFWDPNQITPARDFVNRDFKTAELAVLVIDPVAIYDPSVYQRLMLFQDSLASDKVSIVALPPFPAAGGLIGLRTALLNRGVPYFDDYFQPAVPPVRRVAAQCHWNVVDSEDIRRLMLAAAGRLSPESSAASSSLFLRQA
jgi:hypothetical protein